MPHATRITLLDRVRETQVGASWDEFYDIYSRLIHSWLTTNGVLPQDADDVCQEVMATIFEEISKFEHNGRTGAFRTWLRRITANRMHRLWRRKQTRLAEYSGPDLSEIADQLGQDSSRLSINWDQQHNRFVIEQLLSKLVGRFSEKSLTVFRRIVLDERPAEEVAHDVGMTLGAARVAQHRVLRALKELGSDLIEA
ncbi:RNA polymerase sigma factor RpoE [Pseudobythopirellula maris]|uniref:RNA polymerase sigma factor RpoE n=1 Tax=Pseudobythopirellula maris TaxID=2527991 RepID=A0A5C5ZIT4_9BACT|nr:sigma-70 family RNA polymerase sigma factor [Pseudobythopirellula maris]TWT87302.1 RNA polymerase sigma factor RpoE [Pseudobythopirellula maris]